jgi:hypothetical protein
MSWRENIISSSAGIQALLNETRTIAVLGIKTEAHAGQPAFYVPSYLQTAGFRIIPVPVYYPQAVQILGQQVYRRLVDIPVDVDLVNVFRLTLKIFWGRGLKRYGCNPEFAMIPWPKRSRKPASKSFRTAASWWTIATFRDSSLRYQNFR